MCSRIFQQIYIKGRALAQKIANSGDQQGSASVTIATFYFKRIGKLQA